jgi:hypothetical protein
MPRHATPRQVCNRFEQLLDFVTVWRSEGFIGRVDDVMCERPGRTRGDVSLQVIGVAIKITAEHSHSA